MDLSTSLESLQHDVAHLAADHHPHDPDDDLRLQRLTEHHGDEEKAAAAAAGPTPAPEAPVLAAVPEEPAKPVKSKAAVAAAAVLATVAAPTPAPAPDPLSKSSSGGAASKWAGLRGSVKAGIALHQTRAAVVPKLAMSKDCSAQVNDHEKLLRALVCIGWLWLVRGCEIPPFFRISRFPVEFYLMRMSTSTLKMIY